MSTQQATTQEQKAASEINQKAQEALARINARLPEIELAIRSYEEELGTFPQQRAARVERLNSERATLTSSQTALGKTEAYAKVAIGTLGDKNAIKAVSKAKYTLGQAQKHFDAIQSMLAKGQDVDDAREQELAAQVATLQSEYQSIQAEWQDVESARQQAHSELGAMKATAINDQLNTRQAQIDTLREQLVALQVEHHDDVEEAVKDLAPWPDHRSTLRQRFPGHDETVEVLQHEIAYISSLLRNSQTLIYNQHVFQLLAIPERELHYGENLSTNPKSLRSRLTELQTLLAQHQTSLQR
jgi:hypothetical protein